MMMTGLCLLGFTVIAAVLWANALDRDRIARFPSLQDRFPRVTRVQRKRARRIQLELTSGLAKRVHDAANEQRRAPGDVLDGAINRALDAEKVTRR